MEISLQEAIELYLEPIEDELFDRDGVLLDDHAVKKP
jgi:hypothetical protein